ncbi:hypothetical protein ES702_02339 [subsurface metagenome]
MHKRISSTGEKTQSGTRGKDRKQARKSTIRIPVPDPVDESDEEEDHDTKKSAQARDDEVKARQPPIKIKLIFKPKAAINPRESSDVTDKPSVTKKEAVGVDDTEMNDA